MAIPTTGVGGTTDTVGTVVEGSVVPSSVSPPTPPTPPGPYSPSSYSYQPFTYVLTDLRSGVVKGELPFSGVTFGKTLNGIGQFQGTVDLEDPAMQAVDPLDLTTPASTGLFVDYNGAIVWGGIVWPRARVFQPQSRQLTVTASDVWSYFGQRVQATDYSAPPHSGITGPSVNMPIWDATGTGLLGVYDPLLVAWQIISDALTAPFNSDPALVSFGNILGGLGIAGNGFLTTAGYLASGSATPAGDYVNMTYPYSSMQLISTIVSQLTQLGLTVGFDLGVDCAYSAGQFSAPVATVNLSYPRRGRTFAQNNLVADLSTARSYTFPEDGTQAANTVYEVGASGAISVTENIYPIEQGYPVLEVVKSRSTVTSANVLQLLGNMGLADLALLSYPVVVPQFVTDLFGPSPALGSFIEGDDILVTIPAMDGTGGTWDPGFKGGMYQEWRIASWNAAVKDDGDSTLTVTLNQPPSLAAIQPPITDNPYNV